MSDLIVKVPLAIVKDTEGRHRYLYQGAVVPDGLDQDDVDRLVDEEAFGKPEDPEEDGDDKKPAAKKAAASK